MRLTLFCQHSALVAVLERELAAWKLHYEHERQRAEMAVDELLRIRVQAGPVSLPASTVSKEVEELLKNPEFARAGEVE